VSADLFADVKEALFLNVLLARHRQPTAAILRNNLPMPNEKGPAIIAIAGPSFCSAAK
jgi:hypothetical protein